ncbi:uncharacterized protein C2845_PM03G15010 [Panicum miliaceum]|uniref:Phospholipase A2 family protein n=1 Tax=Panicum miliaceum TaxID=4540 RepID=A0A3L6TDZ2_PANMI|nr:uncharacterized protein C2845_PM03G15010 [Panicum miliaceum]
MEVASSSSSPSPSAAPPASSKPALRLNPAAVLLRRLPTPTPSTATPVTASASPAQAGGGAANPLAAFLSSLIPWREQRPPKQQPDHPAASATASASASAAAARRAAKAAAEEEAEARQLVGCAVPLFRPYVAQLPWHGGARAWLSKLFPRYGHYCGPNWSSGKEAGSVLWDRRPVDHLDFCCYCHDMAYDTHDQAQLLRADLAFLRCLEGSRQTPARDGIVAAVIYRAMCIFGLKTILIPYRTNLVRLQTGPNYADFFADFVKRVASSSGRPTGGEKQRL